jgi:choice-of-anchor B domain-containing protein
MSKKVIYLVLFVLMSNFIFAQNNFSYNVKLRNHTTFTGQTLANICGYWQKGKEYALLGASKGMIIMDVTNPDSAKQIVQIPGPNNLWKEIKVYKNYAYVTSEGGSGLQIVDMSALPSATLVSKFYTGDGAIAGKLNKIHALHIDTLKGVVYCYGTTGVSNGGATMLDVKTDPMNPVYLGAVTKDYIHDGFAHNDTLFAGHINRGEMEVWYTKDKKNPVSLGKTATPTKFTHNIWLSENHKYAFTTDENNSSFLGAYDISDLSNIKLVDKIQTNPGSQAVIHNTHIINDFAVTSYYTEGFTIVDAHRPDNLVEVGRYDTYDTPIDPANPFEGAWGVYPYLPSGTIIVSNINEGLFVLTPKYLRASYLEGTVRVKGTKQVLANTSVKLTKYPLAGANSSLLGEYKTGIADTGLVNVTFVKSGYKTLTTTATLKRGKVTVLDVELEPEATFSMTVRVVDATTLKLLKDIDVAFSSSSQQLSAKTNANGEVVFNTFPDTASVYVGKWGYKIVEDKSFVFNSNIIKNYKLEKGYKDDFISVLPFSWTKSNVSPTGFWTILTPTLTSLQNQSVTPSADVATDLGKECFITGACTSSPGQDDVDDGSVTLTSPSFDLTTYLKPALNFDYWFFNAGGNGTGFNDSLYMIIDNGLAKKRITLAKVTANKWNGYEKTFKELGVAPTANMTVSFVAVDETPGHLVKAAIDKFEIIERAGVDVADLDESIKINAFPNPFSTSLSIDYQLLKNENASIIVNDLMGRIVEKRSLPNTEGKLNLGEKLNAGVYFIQIQNGEKISSPIKVVKN